MTPHLIIIGAGPQGRETFSYALETYPSRNVVGFLDNRPDILDGYAGYPPILGDVESHIVTQDSLYVCAIGDPQARLAYANQIVSKGGMFTSIIHPAAYLGKNVNVGVGCIISPSAVVTADVRIGDHVILNVQSSVSHDCTLEDGVTVSPGVHLAGNCRLGKGSFLGCGCALCPNVALAEGVFVAAGAVVIRSEHRIGSRLMGVPAIVK